MNSRYLASCALARTAQLTHSGIVTPRYGAGDGPLAIAHRGGAGLAEENTLVAFGRSYALGIRYLETDVRLTADGELVLFHDRRLRRLTGHPGAIGDLDSRQLGRLRVLGDTQPVPLLADLLAEFPDARIAIDVKVPEAAPALVELLRRTGAASRVCLAGCWDRPLLRLREQLGPELTVALGWRALSSTLVRLRSGRGLGQLASGAGSIAHVPLRLGGLAIVAGDLVPRAHDAGIRIVVWTVNDPDTMHRLLDSGADGIITDRPDLLREVLIGRGQWRPPTGADESPSPAAL